ATREFRVVWELGGRRSFSFAYNRLVLLPSWRAADGGGDDSRGARALFPRRVSASFLSQERSCDRSGVGARLPGPTDFPSGLGTAGRYDFRTHHYGACGLCHVWGGSCARVSGHFVLDSV